MSRLCLCLTAANLAGWKQQMKRYQGHFNIAEARMDLLDPENRRLAEDFPSHSQVPLILTVRLSEDGGQWGENGETEPDREAYITRLLEKGGWAYVDLEFDKPMPGLVAAAKKSGTRLIRSRHDFLGELLNTPVPELAALIRLMAKDGAIPKLAAVCSGSRQLLALARLAVATEDVGEKVLLGMGEYGSPSRILAQRMGSAWTYSSSVGGEFDPPLAAPGQSDPETLQKLYRFKSIGKDSPLYAVTGNPISHSRSPIIHNHWLQKTGLEGSYLPIRSDDAAAMLETCDIWGIRGLSVTVPHKETALSLCDYSGHLARKIGAANTLLRAGDGWRARNTDAQGFLRPLPAALGFESPDGLKGLRALIIGAGGASRAAVHALMNLGVEIIILNRSVERARKLAEEIGARWGGLDEGSKRFLSDGIDFAIQTTSVGMKPLEGLDPLPWWDFNGCRLVYDMVYEPEETAFLARAKKAGIVTMNGSSMLENQARMQFALFTGHCAPED